MGIFFIDRYYTLKVAGIQEDVIRTEVENAIAEGDFPKTAENLSNLKNNIGLTEENEKLKEESSKLKEQNQKLEQIIRLRNQKYQI